LAPTKNAESLLWKIFDPFRRTRQPAKEAIKIAAFNIYCRCYDFLNIFGEKFSEKIAVFDSIQS
jgi:hypothetical protein